MNDQNKHETEWLYRFLNRNEYREVLRHPFRYKGFIFATDGKVAVRIADDGRELPAVPEGKKAPNMLAVWPKHNTSARRWRIDDMLALIGPAKESPCPECHGFGKMDGYRFGEEGINCLHKTLRIEGPCAIKLDSDSEYTGRFGHVLEYVYVTVFHAGGSDSCEVCGGTGLVSDVLRLARFGETWFDVRLLRLFSGCVLREPLTPKDAAEIEMNGAEGLIMPHSVTNIADGVCEPHVVEPISEAAQ